jgi:hypothetical protein
MLFSNTVATRSSFTYHPTTELKYNVIFNNCSNTLCYTYSNNTVYKPHSAKGLVGTISSSSLARRNRI